MFGESRTRPNPWTVIDDDPAEKVHVWRHTSGGHYVNVEGELGRAIGIFSADNKLRHLSLAIAMEVRDRLRTAAVRDQILELAKKRLEIAEEQTALNNLKSKANPAEFDESGLSKDEEAYDKQVQELARQLDQIITPNE